MAAPTISTAESRETARARPQPERLLAGALVFLLGARLYVAYEFSVAVIAALVLVPVWWRHVRHFQWAQPLLIGSLLCVGAGFWLTELSAIDHVVLSRQVVLNSAMTVSVALGIGLILWARRLLPDLVVAALYGAGMIFSVRPNDGFLLNPWKFGFDKPVSLLVLALACRVGGRVVPALALAGLAGVSAVSDGRSRMGILLVVLVATVLQTLPAPRSARAATFRVLSALVAVGYSAYQLSEAVLLEGILGEAAQQRTEEQIAQSGSLIVGGRPEMAATWSLMQHRFEGFGFGVVAGQSDIRAAKVGMLGINYDPDNGYVNNYMFGTGVELHSGVGDLWAHMGVPGLVLAMGLLVLIIVRLGRLVATRSANAVLLMLGISAVWDFAFSPMKTSVPYLTIALGLLLAARPTATGSNCAPR
ncbi:hypothetical protein [Terracoccus luteus]|uniref:Drug/metabolite transporter (DMT)-like permease n=1 Tax=Terracoccus luteus TaxID=53356 RepID=A0A839PQE7_9MICO|nr:hypothetical protein [Terracoccus luteus]MBB2985727.1 drug/metabolite transporter (DMT)-like permease [Terracoccus luteus]MCP2171379.1 drug/metabolite transporter (DMT)-like permease [Terracoccus luteus]